MNAPRKGDRVRVTYEAEYDCLYHGGHTVSFRLDNYSFNPYLATVPPGAKVEVLKQPVKVGDVIAGSAYETLPIGTVLRGGRDDIVVRTKSGYADTYGDTHSPGGLYASRTVVYLPEVAA